MNKYETILDAAGAFGTQHTLMGWLERDTDAFGFKKYCGGCGWEGKIGRYEFMVFEDNTVALTHIDGEEQDFMVGPVSSPPNHNAFMTARTRMTEADRKYFEAEEAGEDTLDLEEEMDQAQSSMDWYLFETPAWTWAQTCLALHLRTPEPK